MRKIIMTNQTVKFKETSNFDHLDVSERSENMLIASESVKIKGFLDWEDYKKINSQIISDKNQDN